MLYLYYDMSCIFYFILYLLVFQSFPPNNTKASCKQALCLTHLCIPDMVLSMWLALANIYGIHMIFQKLLQMVLSFSVLVPGEGNSYLISHFWAMRTLATHSDSERRFFLGPPRTREISGCAAYHLSSSMAVWYPKWLSSSCRESLDLSG